jgi:hypothetical protein
MHMKERSRYVFGAALASAALGGLPGLMERASAATVTQAAFTFEVSGVPLNATNVTAPAIGPLVAESGIGSAFGSHVASTTVYSSPAGNGSPRSFSSNNWSAGDYYQFNVPTTGVQDILFSFDQISSSTGPKAFNLLYSTDGVNFSTFTNYSLVTSFTTLNSTGGTQTVNSFASGTSWSQFNYQFNLAGISGLNNNPLASFRIADGDTTTAPAGTDRVDNVVVAGNAVPEPAGLALVSIAAAGTLLRRRSQNA